MSDEIDVVAPVEAVEPVEVETEEVETAPELTEEEQAEKEKQHKESIVQKRIDRLTREKY